MPILHITQNMPQNSFERESMGKLMKKKPQ